MLLAGSVRNTVKLAQMDEKWQKKKESKKEQKKKEMTPKMRQLMQYQEDIEQMREGNQISSIDTKLKSGAELTTDEIEYLKKNHPEAYQEYKEIKRERENYKNQLKNCKTKEDVERIKLSKMGNFMAEAKSISQNPNIPKAKKLKLMEKLLKKTVGVYKIHTEFTKSQSFQNLPTEEEKRKGEEVQEEFVRLKTTDIGDMDKKEEFEEMTTEERQEWEGKTMEEGEEFKKRNRKETEKRVRFDTENEKADFEEVKNMILSYMITNREVGGALEYIGSDFDYIGRKGK